MVVFGKLLVVRCLSSVCGSRCCVVYLFLFRLFVSVSGFFVVMVVCLC